MRIGPAVPGTQAALPRRMDGTPHSPLVPGQQHPAPDLWGAVVALYCEDDHATLQVHRVLRRHVAFVQARTLQALAGLARDASCTVLVIRRGPSCDDETGYPGALRRCHPLHPMVAVVSSDGYDRHRLLQSPIDEIVLLRDLERDLGPAVMRACLSGVLEQLAGAVERDRNIPARLRVAVGLACRARPPIRSVKELAAQIGCEPRTLEHHWRKAVPHARRLRLHDLLGWLLLLHASTERLSVTNWTAVGAGLGVCSQTLARLGRNLANVSLREVAALGPRGILPVFGRSVLPALHGSGAHPRDYGKLSASSR